MRLQKLLQQNGKSNTNRMASDTELLATEVTLRSAIPLRESIEGFELKLIFTDTPLETMLRLILPVEHQEQGCVRQDGHDRFDQGCLISKG